VVDCYEDDHKTLGFIKGGEFNHLCNCQLLIKESSPWSKLAQ
jgi:hypothetical protein